jgi:hypothetical protein
MAGLFLTLDTQSAFQKFVTDNLPVTPAPLVGLVRCDITLNVENFGYAFGEYKQSVGKFISMLHSKNPDHRKRSGALVHAVYTTKLIASAELNKNDLQHWQSGLIAVPRELERFINFYSTFSTELTALEFGYRACSAYEADFKAPKFDRLHNACLYLRSSISVDRNTKLDVETCYMLFDLLMG